MLPSVQGAFALLLSAFAGFLVAPASALAGLADDYRSGQNQCENKYISGGVSRATLCVTKDGRVLKEWGNSQEELVGYLGRNHTQYKTLYAKSGYYTVSYEIESGGSRLVEYWCRANRQGKCLSPIKKRLYEPLR